LGLKSQGPGSRVQVFVWGSGFRVQDWGSNLKFERLEFRDQVLGFTFLFYFFGDLWNRIGVKGVALRVESLEFRV
jgi:hypothetical protein